MPSRVLRAFMIAALLWLVLVSIAQARMIVPWSIDRLAKEAPLVAVGEVIDVKPAGTASRSEWGTWIEDMNARVKILRISPASKASGLAVGDVITLWYERYDPEKTVGVGNGYEFPRLSPGDCSAFPLLRSTVYGKEHWQLIDREDIGLIVPCLKNRPKGPSLPTTRLFLVAELADVVALGDPKDIIRAADYLNNLWDAGEQVDLICNRVALVVKDNQERWLDIAVIVYSSMAYPRPSIADLRAGKMPDHSIANAVLVAKALSHIPKDGLDRKFIACTMKYTDLLPDEGGPALSQNYATNPLNVALLVKRLGKGDPSAIAASENVIRVNPDKALLRAALEASVRLVTVKGARPGVGWDAALQLIIEYGSDSQFRAALDVFRESLKDDHDKFISMWWGLSYAKSKRVIDVIRIAITDDTPVPQRPEMRVSDVAAGVLLQLNGVTYPAGARATQADRKQALEKAKQWLAEHP